MTYTVFSLQSQISALEVGQSVAKVRAVDPKMPVSKIPTEMPVLRQQLRNSVTPAVTRAKSTVGGSYSIEVGDMISPQGRYYVVAVVTRTE